MKLEEVKSLDDLNVFQNAEVKKRNQIIEQEYKEKSFITEGLRGKVGIFWITPDEKILPYAIEWVDRLATLEMGPGFTSRASHSDPMPLSMMIGVYPQFRGVPWDEIPRGRVFFKAPVSGNDIGKYTVYMTRDYLDNENVKRKILKEFNLPLKVTEWKTDPHYNKHLGDSSTSKIMGTVKEPWEENR